MAVNNRVKITNDIELKDRLVAINRVTKVTKGGRTFSFSAIVVVGNEDGIIGWGLGKAGEVTAAIAKGVEAAKKNLTRVPVLKGTVPHEQSAKFGGAEVFIKPASTGTGVVAGGAMRAVLESVGITDVLANAFNSNDKKETPIQQLSVEYSFGSCKEIEACQLVTVIAEFAAIYGNKNKNIDKSYGSPGGYDGEVIETMEDLFLLALFEIYTNCVL